MTSFLFLWDVAIATDLGQNLRNDLYSTQGYAAIIGVFHKYSLGDDTTTPSGLYAIGFATHC